MQAENIQKIQILEVILFLGYLQNFFSNINKYLSILFLAPSLISKMVLK